jgi:hypothetical protein
VIQVAPTPQAKDNRDNNQQEKKEKNTHQYKDWVEKQSRKLFVINCEF